MNDKPKAKSKTAMALHVLAILALFGAFVRLYLSLDQVQHGFISPIDYLFLILQNLIIPLALFLIARFVQSSANKSVEVSEE